MNRSYRFRLYPTREQEVILLKTFGCCRFIYNKMLSDKIAYYKATGQMLNATPAQYKDDYPWLKEIDSHALSYVQMDLQSAYNNFFKSPKIGYK